MLPDDGVATNPTIRVKVETFAPTESFNPPTPFATRLMWRDQDSDEQSKLLLSKPETVIAIALRGKAVAAPQSSRPDAPQRPVATPRRKATPKTQPE
jgi:hypothetical protein